MQKRLITTPLEETWKVDQPFLLLGKWCLSKLKFSSSYDYPVNPYHWDDRDMLEDDYSYLEGLYESLLEDCSEYLNKIHQEDHGVRYWRIIIGPWLRDFTEIVFDRWKSIESISNSEADFETEILKFDENRFVPNDITDFGSLINSDEWNHLIYGKVIREFDNITVLEREVGPVDTVIKKTHKSLSVRIKLSILHYAEKIFSLFSRQTDHFFIASYIPIWSEIKLQLLLKQAPVIYAMSAPKVNCATSSQMRNNRIGSAEVHASANKFEQWLRSFLLTQMPKSYLENYADHIAISRKSSWPSKPKSIMTGTAFYGNDHFKIWAADKVEKGSVFIVGQHGGNFGMGKLNSSEAHQVKVSDIYFSWGWTDQRKNIVPIGQLKMTKEVNDDLTKKTKAMLVTVEMPRYSYFLWSAPFAGQWLNYLEQQYSFINALPEHIQDELIVRMKLRKNGWGPYADWKNDFPNIAFDTGTQSDYFRKTSQSRIVISTYNAATYLESMAMNIPTIIFWNPKFWELRDDAYAAMQKLNEVNIFHVTPESAAEHMINIWDDVGAWWYSDDVQNARINFCKTYSNRSTDLILEMANTLNAL